MEVLIERSGRCCGSEHIIKATLWSKRYRNQYQITVSTGVHSFTKSLMKLDLREHSLDQAKTKFYDVLTPLQELWEIDESVSDETT